MTAIPTTRQKAVLVQKDGSCVTYGAEFFSKRKMIWLRNVSIVPDSLKEIRIQDRIFSIKSVENKDQICEICLSTC